MKTFKSSVETYINVIEIWVKILGPNQNGIYEYGLISYILISCHVYQGL